MNTPDGHNDTEVVFEYGQDFPFREKEEALDYAILNVWAAVGTGLRIESMFAHSRVVRLIEQNATMKMEEKVEAFEYVCQHISDFSVCREALLNQKKDLASDAFLAGMMASYVVEHDSSKRQAIAEASRWLKSKKSKFRDAPNKFLVARTSTTQLEEVWRKYESVLHYALIAANVALGDNTVPPKDPNYYPVRALRALRRKNLVREAIVINPLTI